MAISGIVKCCGIATIQPIALVVAKGADKINVFKLARLFFAIQARFDVYATKLAPTDFRKALPQPRKPFESDAVYLACLKCVKT